MIFVTVGAQMSFDRLVGWVDDWAAKREREDVVAQIGPSDFTPRQLRVIPFMSPPEFRARLEAADIVVAHAGMGSILNALELGKPILVVPRHGEWDETRNDHQIATARRLGDEGLVRVADTPEEFERVLDEMEGATSGARIAREAQPQLIDRLKGYAFEGAPGTTSSRPSSGPSLQETS